MSVLPVVASFQLNELFNINHFEEIVNITRFSKLELQKTEIILLQSVLVLKGLIVILSELCWVTEHIFNGI